MWWNSAWKNVGQTAREPLDATATEGRAAARCDGCCVRFWQWMLWRVMNSMLWRRIHCNCSSEQCTPGGSLLATHNDNNNPEVPTGRATALSSGVGGLNSAQYIHANAGILLRLGYSVIFPIFSSSFYCQRCRPVLPIKWLRRLRLGTAAARLRGLQVRIRPEAWLPVSCECCVLSGRGLCVGLITRPEESYQVWCVWVWSCSLFNGKALANRGCSAMDKNTPLFCCTDGVFTWTTE
jgi:hypothetical protein